MSTPPSFPPDLVNRLCALIAGHARDARNMVVVTPPATR
ncbi:hypothetical protein DER29_0522 [Micromonospora sp. M71_S20]|nr:hypothetical protein DER29_0522 [Micromonospora sp. M71_S20]